ncbi:hypothetical protein AOL_s00004g372 [Orbilia oligospora ATCC 24927]|uniref:glucan 1,3-beta-glucosidase n=2 Tax=Orbilia oligospora TaxID=2813651 RepID=G1WYL2_ARTOA|nr:hypothetical protein AOL_s00004g372 [Orbilia oligospora ATCC 24927]EGX54339.1 hypothetical protein AOL_s00004g372 [Orbilia oligospora ATCC 24927]KAF3278169.1 hypothetical protein TWF970_004625 [Orbilia oligospora]
MTGRHSRDHSREHSRSQNRRNSTRQNSTRRESRDRYAAVDTEDSGAEVSPQPRRSSRSHGRHNSSHRHSRSGGVAGEDVRRSRTLEKSQRRPRPPTDGVIPLSEESLAAFNKEEEHRRNRHLSREEKRERKAMGQTKEQRKRRRCCILCLVAFIILLIIILVPIGVLVIGKNDGSPANGGNKSSDGSGGGTGDGLGGSPDVNPNTIPTAAKGSYLDPFTWFDTRDFNTTYTGETVGGLSVMGLFSKWDDSAQPNPNVPPLNEKFEYGKVPMRGVNVGGWLLLEPFITPSFFKKYDLNLGVVDEYTLSAHLGAKATAQTLEKHYATFVTEQTFKEIAEAGLDHVRIPYPYWIVTPEANDPYLPRVGWRYLLRGIEWARKYGLRIKLDLHSIQGGQNGWNHSGRQGILGWVNGTSGEVNAQKSLDMHDQLSKFFAQPRYRNIVTLYGLVNEPRMTALPLNEVLNWTANAYDIIRGNGLNAKIVFGDGFLGLENWKGRLPGLEGLVLDVHQYVIFNIGQIAQTHTGKIQFACSGWGAAMSQSNDPTTGFGPTMVGEFGQADTDCVPYLNNVGTGSRWEGDLIFPDPSSSVTTPSCHTGANCSCTIPNSDPSKWSDLYKQFLLMFASAQMESFELAWGWMYWTWDTEDAYQWSYKKGIAAGTLPKIAYERNFTCDDAIPDFQLLGLSEGY